MRAKLQDCQLHNDMPGLDTQQISWKKDSSLASSADKSLTSHCKSQAMIYLEGHSYSAALKYILACGAVTLRLDSEEYFEFFEESLAEGKHYRLVYVKHKSKNSLTYTSR